MSRSAKAPATPTFETALAEVERIVASMEAGQLPLEQAIASYKRGVELLQFCQNALKEASQQVKLLDGATLTTLDAPVDEEDRDG